MSRGRPKKDDAYTVVQVMKLVSWDYLPDEADQPMDAPAGSFLQDIPWDAGEPEGEPKTTKKPPADD